MLILSLSLPLSRPQVSPEEFNPHVHIPVREGEALVVASFCSLMYLHDGSVLRSNPRDGLLKVRARKKTRSNPTCGLPCSGHRIPLFRMV